MIHFMLQNDRGKLFEYALLIISCHILPLQVNPKVPVDIQIKAWNTQARFIPLDHSFAALDDHWIDHHNEFISTSLVDSGKCAEARAFMPGQMTLAKRVLGSDHPLTLDFQWGYSRAFTRDKDATAEELTEVVDESSGFESPSLDVQVEYEFEDEFQIRRGARVLHKKFGKGTVQKISGRGGDARVEVDFGLHGRRKLILRYAGLQSLD